MKFQFLDLFCGGGGCSAGFYKSAKKNGIDITIVGVDIVRQNGYPFDFVCADAIELLDAIYDFDFVHASPTCQLYSPSTEPYKSKGYDYPDTLSPVRDHLRSQNEIPYSIENVMPAPIRRDIVLHGRMFGLKLIRRRKFEIGNWFTLSSSNVGVEKNLIGRGEAMTVAGNGCKTHYPGQSISKVEGKTILEKWSVAMGIDWMDRKQLAQAIPPVYMEYIADLFFHQFKNKMS